MKSARVKFSLNRAAIIVKKARPAAWRQAVVASNAPSLRRWETYHLNAKSSVAPIRNKSPAAATLAVIGNEVALHARRPNRNSRSIAGRRIKTACALKFAGARRAATRENRPREIHRLLTQCHSRQSPPTLKRECALKAKYRRKKV